MRSDTLRHGASQIVNGSRCKRGERYDLAMNDLPDYGSLLIELDQHGRPAHPVLIKEFTEEEYEHYHDAYKLLGEFVYDSMWPYVSGQCTALLDLVIWLGQEAGRTGQPVMHMPNGELVRQAVAAKLLAAANAVFVYREQREAQAQRMEDRRGDDTFMQVRKILRRLNRECFGYRWMVEGRNAMVHQNLFAFTFSVHRDPGEEVAVQLNFDKSELLRGDNMQQKWAAPFRAELEDPDLEVSAIELLQGILAEMPKAETEILDILYTQKTMNEAIATVWEFVEPFGQRRGMIALKSGPGDPVKNHVRIDPNVLRFLAGDLTLPHVRP